MPRKITESIIQRAVLDWLGTIKGIGIELKPAYARQAAKLLKELEDRPQQMEFFG